MPSRRASAERKNGVKTNGKSSAAMPQPPSLNVDCDAFALAEYRHADWRARGTVLARIVEQDIDQFAEHGGLDPSEARAAGILKHQILGPRVARPSAEVFGQPIGEIGRLALGEQRVGVGTGEEEERLDNVL